MTQPTEDEQEREQTCNTTGTAHDLEKNTNTETQEETTPNEFL